jgi:hypothetical protein
MDRLDVINSLGASTLFRGWWQLDDAEYDPISRAFIEAAHLQWVRGLPEELVVQRLSSSGVSYPIPLWRESNFDCDSIALDFGTYIGRCIAVDSLRTGKKRGAAASGRFNFIVDQRGGHCRTWYIDYDGKAHVFDAGDGRHYDLSATEQQTISYGESI